jgi:hypothetical protein
MKYGRALSEKKKTLSEMRQSGQEYTPERDNELFPRLSRFETETDELAKKAADAERRAINPFYSLKRVFE